MLARDKTYKVKVWDHNDAIIYVYEKEYSSKADPKDPDKMIHKCETAVITAVPINMDWDTDKEAFIQRVAAAASALEDVYSTQPDCEVGVCYVINNPNVNM